MAALGGLEPRNAGIKIQCVTNYTIGLMVAVAGVEPAITRS